VGRRESTQTTELRYQYRENPKEKIPVGYENRGWLGGTSYKNTKLSRYILLIINYTPFILAKLSKPYKSNQNQQS